MSLSCNYDSGADYVWCFMLIDGQSPLTTKRSRKCCSCNTKISIGNLCQAVRRNRPAKDVIEERIYGDDEIPMTNWYLCETCSDLAVSLKELGFCFTLGNESLKQQIITYRKNWELYT